MAELVMDNPFSSSNIQYSKTVGDIKDCIVKIKEEFTETKLPLNDDNPDLHRFCAKLEYLFQAGLKAKTGLLGGRKDYWNYFCDCLSSNKGLNDGIRFVKSISELKTNLGRGRALIRFALVQHRLADTVQQCAFDTKITGDWFQTKSVWLNQQITSEIVSCLYDLNDLQFDLPIQGADLDAAWPSFAKKTLGMHSLHPPSRSTSIGSLSSIPSSLPNQLPAIDSDVQSQVDELEHEKLAAEHKNQELKEHLLSVEAQKQQVETENKQLKDKVLEMEVNSIDISKKSGGYDVLCEKLANELKMKDELFAQREELLKKSLEDSKKIIDHLEEQLASTIKSNSESSHTTDTDILELRGKVKISQTENKTLRINLHSTQKELEARGKVDVAKSKLIDMQEKKILQQKSEIEKQHSQVEELLKGKTSDVDRYVKTSDELRQVKNDLTDREHAYECLMKSHKELKEMLHDIEKKSGDIGKIAKEKLTKYSAENKDLKEKIAQLESVVETSNDKDNVDMNSKVAEMSREKEAFKKLLQDTTTRLEEKEETLKVTEEKLHNSKQEVLTLKAVMDGLKSDSTINESQINETLLKIQSDSAKLQSDLDRWKEKSESQERVLETKTFEWVKEKESLITELDNKTKEFQMITVNLKEKIKSLEECEKNMEGEKELMVKQLEGQSSEIALLKEELTGLSQLLGQAVAEEIDGYPENLFEKLKAIMEKNSMLEKSLEAVEVRNKQLINHVKESEAKFEEAQSDLNEMKTERHSLESQILKFESAISDFERQLEGKTKEMESLLKVQIEFEKQIKDLELQMKQSKENALELSDESETKDKMIAAKQQQFHAINEKVELMQQLISQLEGDKEKAEEDLDKLKADVESNQSKIFELTSNLETEQEFKKCLENKLSDIKEKYCESQSQLQQNVAFVSEKTTEHMQTMESKTKIAHELEESENHKKILEQNIDSLTQELKQAKTKVEETNLTNQSHVEKLEKMQTEFLSQNTDLTNFVKKLEADKEEHLNEIQVLKQVKSKLTAKIDKLEFDCDKLLQDVSKFEKENETLSQCVKNMEHEKASLECQSDKLKVEAESLRKAIAESSHLHQDLVNQLTKANLDSSESDVLMTQFKEKVKEMTQEIVELKEQVKNSKAEKENLLKKLDEVETEKVSISENMNASYFELKEKTGQFECENERLREEIQCVALDKENMFTKMSEENSDLQSNIEKLNNEAIKKSTLCADLEKKVQSLSKDIETFQTSIAEKDKFVCVVQNEMKEIEFEKVKLQSIINSDGDEKENELRNMGLQLSELKSTLQEKNNEILMLHTTHEQELKAMQFQLSTEQMQHQQSMKEYEEKDTDAESMSEKMTELECNVEDLQASLKKQTQEGQILQKQHRKQIEELEEKLVHKINECQAMAEQLVKNNQSIEKERSSFVTLQKQRKESDSQVESLQNEMTNTEAENVELKKKIIQLIREKDTLWKKSDKLQFKQKVMVSQITGVWANNTNVTNCTKCNTQFGFTVRKHHCRLCGQIFCYYCCNNWVMTSFSNKQERVCGECLMNQSHLESASEGEDTDGENDLSVVEQSVQIPALRSPMWKHKAEDEMQESEMKESLEDDCGATSVKAYIEHQNIVASIKTEHEEIDQEKLLNMTDESKSGRLQQNVNVKESSASPSEDGYDLITTEEVQLSSDVPVPDPDTYMAAMLSMDDFADEKAVESNPELWIKPGKAFCTAVNIETRGTILTWEFTTYPKDINFSLRYGETEWTSFEETEALIPVCKCHSHKKPINGELTARKPGVYSLIFDNKSSRFTSKKLTYKLELKVNPLDGDDT